MGILKPVQPALLQKDQLAPPIETIDAAGMGGGAEGAVEVVPPPPPQAPAITEMLNATAKRKRILIPPTLVLLARHGYVSLAMALC